MTTFRTGPSLGAPLTPWEFGQGAMENPLSRWDTLTGSAADAFLQTPGAGLAIRQIQTPGLAMEPVPGGRGWRYSTPEQVEARGDELLETPEKFKASPSYRKAIPHERGMTESRLKALADFHDVSQVRQFYAAKRPVTAFVGGILGSIPDPINFIPIVRAGTTIAGASHLARIGHSAAIGAADAAANSAIFQTAFARDKAKFGDDTSWQAIATNAAFSALAGTVIGGGIGALTRAPKVAAGVPDAVAAVVPDRLGTAGDVTARFGDVSRGTVEPQTTVDVSGYAPTPHLEAIRTWALGSKVTDATGQPLKVYHGTDRSFDQFSIRKAGAKGVSKDGIFFSTDPDTANFYAKWNWDRTKDRPTGFLGAIGRSRVAPNIRPSYLLIKNPFVAPSRYFDMAALKKQGYDGVHIKEKYGDVWVAFSPDQIKSALDAPPDVASSFTGTVEMRAKAVAVMNEAIYSALTYGDIRLGPNAQAHVAEVGAAVRKAETVPVESAAPNYSAPEPVTLSPGFTEAFARVEANAKPAPDPLARDIEAAKREGFDPETGEHDLADDVAAMMEQDVLTDPEKAALKAADENFAVAQGWEDVMNAIRTCVLK